MGDLFDWLGLGEAEDSAGPSAAPQPDTRLVLRPAAAGQLVAGQGGQLANLPAGVLARCLPQLRQGDPLGLGATSRPPPPPDPDRHNLAEEDAGYARSLLTQGERAALDAEIQKGGYWPVGAVREFVAENSSKASLASGGLDPELL